MLLYGKPVVEKLKESQRDRITKAGFRPRLAIIQAGNNLASTTYIKMKQRYGESIGADVDHHICEGGLDELTELVKKLNHDSTVHGIIIQLPLPDQTITDKVVTLIDPTKDVDGLAPGSSFDAATAAAALALLDGHGIEIKGRTIAMVGYGRLVGEPLTRMMRELGANVLICDINTKDLRAETLKADVVVSATGVGGLIKSDMVHDGTVVVDVGTAEDAGAIVGDADPSLLDNETLKITPAKGGVGPITVAMLFEHLLRAAKIK